MLMEINDLEIKILITKGSLKPITGDILISAGTIE